MTDTLQPILSGLSPQPLNNPHMSQRKECERMAVKLGPVVTVQGCTNTVIIDFLKGVGNKVG